MINPHRLSILQAADSKLIPPHAMPAVAVCQQRYRIKSPAGFTLLEVLIALSILAILMTGLIKIAANNTRNLWFLENITIAEQVAQNRLLQLRLADDKPEKADGWDEMAGRRWYWQVSRAVGHTLGAGVWRYQVQVFLEGEQAPYADLVGYVAGAL